MKILIIGGNRYVGKLVVESLGSLLHDVTLVNRSGTGTRTHTKLKMDRNSEEFMTYLKDNEFDSIVDFCCYNLSECKQTTSAMRTKQYIFVSSLASKFSQFGKYGHDKWECEAWLLRNVENYCIVRPPYIVGPKDPKQRIQNLYKAFNEGKSVNFNDALINVVHHNDIRDNILTLIDNRVTRKAYNLCGNEVTSLYDLGRSIHQDFKFNSTDYQVKSELPGPCYTNELNFKWDFDHKYISLVDIFNEIEHDITVEEYWREML